MKVNLNDISIENSTPQIVGFLTLEKVTAKPYYIDKNEERPEISGFTFLYEGGKFGSQFLDPKVGKAFADKIGNNSIFIDKVELVVRPAQLGQYKKDCFISTKILSINIKGKEVFRCD
jgi:hypothetical protein